MLYFFLEILEIFFKLILNLLLILSLIKLRIFIGKFVMIVIVFWTNICLLIPTNAGFNDYPFDHISVFISIFQIDLLKVPFTLSSKEIGLFLIVSLSSSVQSFSTCPYNSCRLMTHSLLVVGIVRKNSFFLGGGRYFLWGSFLVSWYIVC